MMGRIYESFIASHENVMGIDETFIVLHPNGQMPKKVEVVYTLQMGFYTSFKLDNIV
jgi:hypothetical protein